MERCKLGSTSLTQGSRESKHERQTEGPRENKSEGALEREGDLNKGHLRKRERDMTERTDMGQEGETRHLDQTTWKQM